MASATDSSYGIRITFIVILFFSLTFLPPVSAGSSMPSRESEDMKQKKMVLGSRPPQCVNRCSNCKPCMAALVTPPHHKNGVRGPSSSKGDESYYLLSWKCKCGDKYFQP
ncbi:EPIDERMAL PATTERNING FACTOR-like protein 8 [Populus nigra]|uniref:EPIDERMAL PATTERNING FACTOR-like protein 8 n=1 Tax=Populus nigra TaxID=3691 RepID=UPI002B2746D7|nr:EPIDERMAL PATTERNING FACTOR-like protein 8 [Populus nigra]